VTRRRLLRLLVSTRKLVGSGPHTVNKPSSTNLHQTSHLHQQTFAAPSTTATTSSTIVKNQAKGLIPSSTCSPQDRLLICVCLLTGNKTLQSYTLPPTFCATRILFVACRLLIYARCPLFLVANLLGWYFALIREASSLWS
jgi:hypothetical protein